MSDGKTKKPYRPPRLIAHGTLRDLSRGAKGGAASDSGAPKTKATGKG